MTPTFATDAQTQVWAALERINAAWLGGALENLDAALHPRMVIVPPGFAQHIEGAADCAEGYRDFARSATVESFEVSQASVDVFGATAVVSYGYQLTYTMADKHYQDTGNDLYVFVFEDGRWQAAWRTLVPAEKE